MTLKNYIVQLFRDMPIDSLETSVTIKVHVSPSFNYKKNEWEIIVVDDPDASHISFQVKL